GDDDFDVVDRPKRGDVVQGMMRRAQRAVAYAGADADQLHRPIAVANVVFDLLQGAGGEKTRGRHRKDDLSGAGEPGGDSHKVLLGDPQFDDLIRQLLSEWPEFSRAARITGH